MQRSIYVERANEDVLARVPGGQMVAQMKQGHTVII